MVLPAITSLFTGFYFKSALRLPVALHAAPCGEALPVLLAVFEKHDAIEGQFDEESQGMLEVTPEPNLIIRLNGEDVESVRDAFDRLAACCETLACARRLMKIMPGNERPD